MENKPRYPKIEARIRSISPTYILDFVFRLLDFYGVRKEEIERFRAEASMITDKQYSDRLLLCNKWVTVIDDKNF